MRQTRFHGLQVGQRDKEFHCCFLCLSFFFLGGGETMWKPSRPFVLEFENVIKCSATKNNRQALHPLQTLVE